MTAQIPDGLKNNHPTVSFGDLELYAVVIGDIKAEYGWGEGFYKIPINPDPPEDADGCSALWSGYTTTFELLETGQLKLVSYNYPFSDSKKKDEVNYTLTGNFWLVMRAGFEEPKVYVPFVDGFIITDYNLWQHADY